MLPNGQNAFLGEVACGAAIHARIQVLSLKFSCISTWLQVAHDVAARATLGCQLVTSLLLRATCESGRREDLESCLLPMPLVASSVVLNTNGGNGRLRCARDGESLLMF